ncbi:MAG: alanine--glyoxylate aminotransferase family protein [Verrucomicrobiae bacterium]|nr:alanine--glyoxylate aminotransferase family protein [Verrucomicrobiae bacterium]
MGHVKLFIPGPVEVSRKTFEAFCRPMVGHRSKDFQELYASIQPRLREAFRTTRPVYLSTSSAWGVMEAAIRNLVRGKVLNCMSGAFSDKWYDVSVRCGREAVKCQVEWGKPITGELVDRHLSAGGFDAVTLIHNETSTGTMNPLADVAEAVRRHPDVMLIVDTVSSFSVLPIEPEKLGIDVMLTGSQKALALPPGLALFTLSQRALDRAAQVPARGYYFDFVEFHANAEKNMTISTPSIGHINALKSKLEDIFEEGLENRYERHRRNNAMVRKWAKERGFELFPEPGYESLSLTCIRNNRNLDLPAVNKALKEKHGFLIDGGYGKLKGQTFRISNMGDETEETMGALLRALDDVIG